MMGHGGILHSQNLAGKHKEIISCIGSLETNLEQARRDLSAIIATKPDGRITTTDIAAQIIADKGLDTKDRHLRKAAAYKLVQMLRVWHKRRQIERVGKVGTAIVWRLGRSAINA